MSHFQSRQQEKNRSNHIKKITSIVPPMHRQKESIYMQMIRLILICSSLWMVTQTVVAQTTAEQTQHLDAFYEVWRQVDQQPPP
jgi:C4-dicarboxylate transporter